MSNSLRIQLIGELQAKGSDWNLDAFGRLLGRLSNEVDYTGDLIRYVRYDGFTGGNCDVRFFGVEVDNIGTIPEGMVAWDVCEDTFTVYRPKDGKKEILWHGKLTWNWFDHTESGSLVGEFTAQCHPDWNRWNTASDFEFHITANAYFAKGKSCDDNVDLVDYDPAWQTQYDEMAKKLHNLLGSDIALRIEHYGSTSISGMPAKPIIDILVEIPSFDEARRYVVPVLCSPECEYWLYSDHLVFIVRKELMGKRTHHIHMAPAGNQIWRGIVFRDYLRSHPDDASHYRALKYKLAKRYHSDRERYTIAKNDFVREITEIAMKEAGK